MKIYKKTAKNDSKKKKKGNKMTYLHVYPDVFQKIGEFLESDDLFSMALTCKAAYKAFHRKDIQARISWPLLKPKRLTMDQREVIRQMEASRVPVKLVTSSVGSGKSICSVAYTLRKNFDKIFIIVPPNLITMWVNTCIEFFGISPFVMHNSNPKYNRWVEHRLVDSHPERIFIMSYKIFSMNTFAWTGELTNVAYIVDEAHHSVDLSGKRCDDFIALSATAFKKDSLSYGVKNIIDQYGVGIEDITFKLDKTVISSKLPEVLHLTPHTWKISDNLVEYIMKRKRVLVPSRKNPEIFKSENDLRDLSWIPEVLTHTFIQDYEMNYIGETLMIDGKTFNIARNRKIWDVRFREYELTHPRLNWKDFNRSEAKHFEPEVNRMLEGVIKYKQCWAICQHLKNIGEKGIVFDLNITYLPFLYKYLTERGINCYMFSTHYDVGSRQKQLEKFKADKTAQVLLSSIAMLGEGHNVTEANHVIFLSTFSDQNKYYQAIGRCHRYPQDKTVYVHHLFNSDFDRAIFDHSKNLLDISLLKWDSLLRA